MTRDDRSDILVLALVLSLVIHVGLVIGLRPQVMTHVGVSSATHARRGPIRFREPAPRPETVSLASVPDEASERPAPEMTDTASLVPVTDDTAPAASAAALVPVASAAAPDLSLEPALARPELASPEAAPSEPVAPPVLTSEFSTDIPPLAAPAPQPFFAAEHPVAPDFSAPVFSGAAPSAEWAVRAGESSAREAAETSFAPSAEVMEALDERAVRAEQAAVNALLDAGESNDLNGRVTVDLATAQEGEWTYFRLTFCPREELAVVPKDLVILLDASGSIGSDRLVSCRLAAKRILRSATNSGDRFNLVAFRDRFAYAFRSWRPCDAESFAAAEKWLANLAAHGRTDVFSTMASLLTLPRDPARPLVALVVTDGEANAGVRRNAEILSKFAALNDGLVSVYMYGVKSSANAELIDRLTHANRGESFIYEGSRWRAGEGIDELSVRFRDPVLSDLRVVFTSDTPATGYPNRLKNLYRGDTATFCGRIRGAPSDLAFALRGLSAGRAYVGFWRLPFAAARPDAALPRDYRREAALFDSVP